MIHIKKNICNKLDKAFPIRSLRGLCCCNCINNVPLYELMDKKKVGQVCVVGMIYDKKASPVYLLPGGHGICELHDKELSPTKKNRR